MVPPDVVLVVSTLIKNLLLAGIIQLSDGAPESLLLNLVNKINLLAFCSDLKYGDTEHLKNFSEKILLRCPELRNKIKIYNTGINYFKIFNLMSSLSCSLF